MRSLHYLVTLKPTLHTTSTTAPSEPLSLSHSLSLPPFLPPSLPPFLPPSLPPFLPPSLPPFLLIPSYIILCVKNTIPTIQGHYGS